MAPERTLFAENAEISLKFQGNIRENTAGDEPILHSYTSHTHTHTQSYCLTLDVSDRADR